MNEDSKEKLLSAAAELFARFGYDGVSIRQISEAAGTNSAMISYYFGGKRGLYDAVMASFLTPIAEFTVEDLTALDPREVVRRYAAEMLAVHQKRPELLPYIFREFTTPQTSPHSLFRSIVSKLFAVLSGALARGVKTGLFCRDLDVPSATILLAGAVNFFYLSAVPRGKLQFTLPDEERYMTQAVDVFLRGISAERHPS